MHHAKRSNDRFVLHPSAPDIERIVMLLGPRSPGQALALRSDTCSRNERTSFTPIAGACALTRLCRTPDRYKTDLDPLVQRARYPAQHRQGVAFIIGILKAADDRRGGTYELGKLSLSD